MLYVWKDVSVSVPRTQTVLAEDERPQSWQVVQDGRYLVHASEKTFAHVQFDQVWAQADKALVSVGHSQAADDRYPQRLDLADFAQVLLEAYELSSFASTVAVRLECCELRHEFGLVLFEQGLRTGASSLHLVRTHERARSWCPE